MRSFNASSCNDAFVQVAHALVKTPDHVVSPRGQSTWEITNVVITVANPYDRFVVHPSRNLSLRYFAGEFLWYERGSNRLSEISYYSKFWNSCSDDGVSIRSAYGSRLYHEANDQWATVRQELVRDPSSRRAVLSILNPADVRDGVRDVPCTVGLQFFIRNEELNMTVWMRSNDLFLGFCYDAAIFTTWQEKMLVELQESFPALTMGSYTHIATSMHVYETHYERIREVAREPAATISHAMFLPPRIMNVTAIAEVQKFEREMRENAVGKLAPPAYRDPFAQWLASCLNES